ISELLQRIQATGLLRRYAPRNDGPKNRTVQRYGLSNKLIFFTYSWIILGLGVNCPFSLITAVSSKLFVNACTQIERLKRESIPCVG
ncbi:hypothetical protein, partial [Legionella pneumophila]